MMHHKFLEKQKQAKPKSSRWKEIITIRAEISEMVMKRKTHKESMKQRVGSLKR
jgi:hypothetical protein